MKRILGAVLVATILVLALAVVAGCGSSGGTSGETGGSGSPGGSSAGGATVVAKGFAFSPASVSIKVGESVTWTNEDSATHTVTGDGGIDSGSLANGQSYTKTFDTAGTFAYKCTIHPSMTGEVVVK